jgi:hypothetical protein
MFLPQKFRNPCLKGLAASWNLHNQQAVIGEP